MATAHPEDNSSNEDKLSCGHSSGCAGCFTSWAAQPAPVKKEKREGAADGKDTQPRGESQEQVGAATLLQPKAIVETQLPQVVCLR